MDGDKCVGAIVCKLDLHKKMVRRGYIAMLAVDKDYRRRKIGLYNITPILLVGSIKYWITVVHVGLVISNTKYCISDMYPCDFSEATLMRRRPLWRGH